MALDKMNKLIVTTSWDDGLITDRRLATLLDKYNIAGTFYITRGQYSAQDLLGENDIKSISTKFEIGAHTMLHSDLTKTSLTQAKKEIVTSKTYLENLLGHTVNMFSYPYGKYNRAVKDIVMDAGFIAARTCIYGGTNSIKDPYEWRVTLQCSNASPLMAFKTWAKTGISVKALLDWEIRAMLLFDLALVKGGVYHLYGHSWEIQENREWDKLDRVLCYIANRKDVRYLTNREVFS